jgi:ABC-type uncharacterized transport system auxiliary subunit
MKARGLRRVIFLALLALPLGCFKEAVRHYYTLTFPPGPSRFASPFPYTVRVKDFAINATYEGDQLVYREDVNEVAYEKERRWTERPQRMVADMARKYLRQSGIVEQVIEKLGEKPPDFMLEGDIDAIEELDSGQDTYAHLAVSLRLVRFDTDLVVWRHSFEERRKVPGEKARAVVRALSEILEQELNKSVDELGKYFAEEQAKKQGGLPAPPKAEPPATELKPTPPSGEVPAGPDQPATADLGPDAPKAEPPVAEKPAPKAADTAIHPDPNSPLAQHPQLLRDETSMPAGKGAIFLPALSDDPEREPPVAIYRDNELVAQGRMGSRIAVDPGRYEVRFGSGAGRQQLTLQVVVEEGRVTIGPPGWAAMELRVVNDHFIGFRGSYEIISMPEREEYGIGFGVDEEQGEEVKVWVLPPGLYKVVQAGGTYRDRVNFATVWLQGGKLTHFTLVKDQDTNDFKGAGVSTDEEIMATTSGPWKKSLVIGGDAKVSYTNGVGSGWNIDLSIFGDALFRYLKEPHLFVSRLELEEGLLRPASTRRFEVYYDRLYFHNIYIFHLLSWLGPYAQAGLETKVLPRWQDYDAPRDIDEYDAGGNYVRTYQATDRIKLGNPLAPLQLKEGVGGNARVLHMLWVDLDVRLGIGAWQYFPFGELRVDSTTGYDRLIQTAQYHLEGVEGAIVGTARLSRWFIITTEFDGLLPFDQAANAVFTWRSQASLRIVSFASLNYLLNVTRDPNVKAGPVMLWEQLFQLRFSYSVL